MDRHDNGMAAQDGPTGGDPDPDCYFKAADGTPLPDGIPEADGAEMAQHPVEGRTSG